MAVISKEAYLRESEARGDSSVSTPSASSSRMLSNFPPFRLCRVCNMYISIASFQMIVKYDSVQFDKDISDNLVVFGLHSIMWIL